MSPDQMELLAKLENFTVDGTNTKLRFVDRLARENGWTPTQADRVWKEYKRFAFLAKHAGHTVCPSEDVDQAWHLHLVYTRNYWNEFCPKVLGVPLHHGPTEGGEAEQVKHIDMYQKTLESYERLFGEAPPTDIWPSADQRFGHDIAWKRVNTQDHWVLRKLKLPHPKSLLAFPGWVRSNVLGLPMVLFALLFLTGCDGEMNPLAWKNAEFLTFIPVCWVLLLIWAIVVTKSMTKRPEPETEPQVDNYDLAYMAGQEQRVFETATMELVRRGNLQVGPDTDKLVTVTPPNLDAPRVERKVYDAHKDASNTRSARKRLPSCQDELEPKLVNLGLMIPSATGSLILTLSGFPLVLLLLLGVIRLVNGVANGHPVTYLLIEVVVVFMTLCIFAKKPRLTAYGSRYIKAKQAELNALHKKRAGRGFDTDDVGLGAAVALGGVAMMYGAELEPLKQQLTPKSQGGSGCSTGGGSGCGGGDGGGGGCGGGGCGGGGD